MSEDIRSDSSQLAPPRPENWLTKVRKSRYKPLFVIGVSDVAFIPLLEFNICLSILFLVIIIGVLLWLVRLDNIWHQLMVGTSALLIAALLATALYIPTMYSSAAQDMQDLGHVTYDADVSPIYGDSGTNYTFSIAFPFTVNNTNAVHAHVQIYEDAASLSYHDPLNMSMTLDSITNASGTYIYHFDYSTQLIKAINAFRFVVNASGTWTAIGIPADDGVVYLKYGPISSNGFAVFAELLPLWLYQIFALGFIQFIIIVLFIRFSAKSRDARTKVMEDYKKKQEQQREELDKSKPSGTGPSKEDTFICSECGVDVSSTAKFCPNCGEPFDEDEEGEKDRQN